MEPYDLRAIFSNAGLDIADEKLEKITLYVEKVYRVSKKFRITGMRTRESIARSLIVESIVPLIGLDVPRGTFFADIGSGAGIPGVPALVYFSEWKGVLIDSNEKKARFLKSVIRELGLNNGDVIHGRVEEIARSGARETFDLVLARAVGKRPLVMELGAPLLKERGTLYVYSGEGEQPGENKLKEYAEQFGLQIDEDGNSDGEGVIMTKTGRTDCKYPRRYSVIRRDAEDLNA